MGVDCKRLLFTPRQLDETNGVRLVSVGRLVEKKGFEYAIRAVANLLEFYPDIEYTIVGDGPLKERLQELVQKLHVSDVIHFVGQRKQEEVIDILARSHVLLAPSVTAEDGDQEGIPVTLMEAMAVGLPVLSTLHSGIPELVQDGVSGFLVPERDMDALSNRLAYLIEHPEIWPEIGLQGREFIEEHHNINKLNDRLVEIYDRLQ
jgi:colanic acid/amylovoran biosynthesis glycosyltransferase